MKKSELNILFMGTPAFALPSLRMLCREGYPVAGVITQPDRPAGRGHKLISPPVKIEAERLGVPVCQFEKFSKEGLELAESLAPNLFVTAAFGQILSSRALAIPEFGCINVHASLLPKYRGAAPIETAILNGEEETGVTTMFTVRKLDAGDVLEQDRLPISPEDTGGSLREKLAILGAKTLKRTLEKLLLGELRRTPQEEEEATFAPSFPKGFGKVDFSRPSREIVNSIRGINPEPGAYALYNGEKIKLWLADIADAPMTGANPGQILSASPEAGLVVSTADGAVDIKEMQCPGSKPMGAADFLRGHRDFFKCGAFFE